MVPSARHLLCFPILHTPADLGGLAPMFGPAATAKAGAEAWLARLAAVNEMWDRIEQVVLQLDLDFARTLVYQDGLPICGREAEIVEELARAGSRNHHLLRTLRTRGAILMGTESPELLVEEYELARQVLDAARAGAGQTEPQRELAAGLLKRRDHFIARRIDETLPPDTTGLLFIGALHRVATCLPADISVTYPIGMPK